MTLQTILPQEAKRLIDDGAVLVDISEADEHARENIPGARHIACRNWTKPTLPRIPANRHLPLPIRRPHKRPKREARGESRRNLQGVSLGRRLGGWRKAGLPTAVDTRQPIELQRQVQIGAGGLTLLGTLLGLTASPWFFAVPLFVGTGLLFAGITGFCGMALLLQRAPWNQTATAA